MYNHGIKSRFNTGSYRGISAKTINRKNYKKQLIENN